MHTISDNVTRKFTEVFDASEWEIETDTGWQPLIDVKQTVPYEVWVLELENGMVLKCADDHILFDENMNEVFVKNLKIGDLVQTKSGPIPVKSVTNTNILENMYDVGVDSDDHRFYSDDFLSHNTTTAVGYLLWYSMFNDDSTILIAAHKHIGAREIMERIRFAYENCPDHIRAGVTDYNKESIKFENGSRIMAQTTTETTGRGMSLSLVFLDEFAYVEPYIAANFWTSLSPTLATGGKCIITSTPNSDEDQFAQIWKEANDMVDEYGNTTTVGKNGFKPFKAIWSAHPDRDEKWAAEERGRLGPERFLREHECEFLVFAETLIDSVKLSNLKPTEPIMKLGQCRWFRRIHSKSTYVVALDPSMGTGGDPAALQVIELPSLEQVAEWTNNTTPIQGQVKILRDVCKYIEEECKNKDTVPSIYYSIENNAIGEAALIAISEMGEDTIPGFFLSEPLKKGHARKFRKGFNTTHNNKMAACSKLKHLIETDRLTIHSQSLISELKLFIAKGITFGAKGRSHDDLVSAMLLGLRMIMLLQDWDPAIYDKMREETEEVYEMPMPIFISSL